MIPEYKVCSICKKRLPINMFNNAKIEKSADLHHSYCRKCFSEYVKTRRHALGENLPLCENASCSSFLGVYISEAVLSTVFNSVVRAPYGNIGYDFVCGKGLKIDVKSSCFHKKINAWSFCTKKNKIADYFICLAFSRNPEVFKLFSKTLNN